MWPTLDIQENDTHTHTHTHTHSPSTNGTVEFFIVNQLKARQEVTCTLTDFRILEAPKIKPRKQQCTNSLLWKNMLWKKGRKLCFFSFFPKCVCWPKACTQSLHWQGGGPQRDKAKRAHRHKHRHRHTHLRETGVWTGTILWGCALVVKHQCTHSGVQHQVAGIIAAWA